MHLKSINIKADYTVNGKYPIYQKNKFSGYSNSY